MKHNWLNVCKSVLSALSLLYKPINKRANEKVDCKVEADRKDRPNSVREVHPVQRRTQTEINESILTLNKSQWKQQGS